MTSEERGEFQRLMGGVLARSPEAAKELVDLYGDHIIRVVRRRLHRRLRSKFDSTDFQQDVWASFFANPPETFDGPNSLAAFLAKVARNKVLMAVRQRRLQKYNMDRENSLDGSAAFHAGDVTSREPTPSQVAVAHEKMSHLARGESTQGRRILALLNEGHTHEQIASELGVNAKTVQRLVRRLQPRALS